MAPIMSDGLARPKGFEPLTPRSEVCAFVQTAALFFRCLPCVLFGTHRCGPHPALTIAERDAPERAAG